MVFSSLKFIFIFLPVFILIYWICPVRWKNVVILSTSVIFYTIGCLNTPAYLALFLISIILNYFIAILMERTNNNIKRRILLVGGLIIDFGGLFVFKYAGFCLSIFNVMFPFLPKLNLILPLGISFYTFQMVSYLIDTYKKEEKAERSFINFAVYISMFPQLIAGPIVTYGSVKNQIKSERKCEPENIASGMKIFIAGLASKVLIANQIGSLWSNIGGIGYESISTPLAWLGIFAFSFQIYFDFWGYSLMAIGLGRMMSIRLPQNFNNPYTSISVTEFWRRWHMTLGQWFKKYIYIPLGGSRTTTLKIIRNLFIVWLFTGIWHGAGWNFIIWGMVSFILILIEKLGLKKLLDRCHFLGHVYIIFVIPLTWGIFAITDLKELQTYFLRLFPIFGNRGAVIFEKDYLKYLNQYKFTLMAAIAGSTVLPTFIYNKIKEKYVGDIIFIILFWAAVYCLYKGMNDPFLYFRF